MDLLQLNCKMEDLRLISSFYGALNGGVKKDSGNSVDFVHI